MFAAAKFFALVLECLSSAQPFTVSWDVKTESVDTSLGELVSFELRLKLLSPPGLEACILDAAADAEH